MNKIFFVICLIGITAALAACKTAPQQELVQDSAIGGDVNQSLVKQPFDEPDFTAKEFDGDLIYRYLLAEVSAQRNELDVALDEYSQTLTLTKEPYAAERATRIALHLKKYDEGVKAARLWVDLEPNSLKARLLSAMMFFRSAEFEQAKHQISVLIRIANTKDENGFVLVARTFLAEKDQAGALGLMQNLARENPSDFRSHYALGILEAQQKHFPEAETALKKAISIDGNQALPRLLLARVYLAQQKNDLALAHLQQSVSDLPEENELRSNYARHLVSTEQFDKALEQFRLLHKLQPKNHDISYGLAMLALQEKRWDEARQLWQTLREQSKFREEASYFLAQVEELDDNLELALDLYISVDRGELVIDAVIRRAILLARVNRLQQAREVLKQARIKYKTRLVDLYLTEIQILQKTKADEGLIKTLFTVALTEKPEDNALQYNRGLFMAEINDFVAMEADFKAVLARDENHVDALNALGYTLADQNERLDEAFEYVAKALSMEPNNPAILDSMGWVNYRMGDLPSALKNLRAAVTDKLDSEIAAHLGEVLWVSGDQTAAKKVWEKALKLVPNSQAIKSTIERLRTDR